MSNDNSTHRRNGRRIISGFATGEHPFLTAEREEYKEVNFREILKVYRTAAWLIVSIAFLPTWRALSAGNVPPEPGGAAESAESSTEKTAKAEQHKKIAALIEQMGDKDYFVRQKAQEDLAGMSFEAFEQLNAATTNDDLEIATRAKYLIKLMRVEWTTPADPPEVKRLLKSYEMLDAENREGRIRDLAALPDGKSIPALCRLARYEKSNVLSKRAALELMQSTSNGEPPTAQRVNLIRKNIEHGTRPGVQWIDAWLRMARDPQAAMDEFKRLSDAEAQILQRSPNETNPELVASFMRYYIAQLKRLGKNDAVAQAMRQLIELQKDDSNAIADLTEWFVDQKAWEPLDDLAKKFAPRFAAEPIPLYLYAQAKLEQNDTAKAQELAAQALKLNPGREALMQHSLVAQYLKKRGCAPWAISEYEYMIAQSGDQDYFALRSATVLAEIYFDQGKNLEAGKTLEKFLKKPSIRRLLSLGPTADVPLEQVRAEMYFYFGCHWESQGDRKQQRENMEKAVKEDPTDINALIGYYHLPDLSPEEKQKAVEMIDKVASEVLESIHNAQKTPDDPRENLYMESKEASDCNQFAWLIANTEGNFDEALRCARRAVELQPANGGIYDTLAHAYYAKGDFENAVKIEEKAHQLDPHSVMIQKKLELFKKALEEKK
jgi:tetratricopeptide (TPR) repeat protein